MEIFLLIILRFWAVRISFRYAIVYASSVAFVRRVDHSSFILSCNLIGQRENKSRYVTEIVLPLEYVDVTFRRRESRQPAIRLRSQAIACVAGAWNLRCAREGDSRACTSFALACLPPAHSTLFFAPYIFFMRLPPAQASFKPKLQTHNIQCYTLHLFLVWKPKRMVCTDSSLGIFNGMSYQPTIFYICFPFQYIFSILKKLIGFNR